MQCEKCKIEMEKGYLLKGLIWGPGEHPNDKRFVIKLSVKNGCNVYANKCPNCKEIKLVAEE